MSARIVARTTANNAHPYRAIDSPRLDQDGEQLLRLRASGFRNEVSTEAPPGCPSKTHYQPRRWMSLVLPYIPRLICDEECRHKIGGKGENASGKSEGVVLKQGSRLTA